MNAGIGSDEIIEKLNRDHRIILEELLIVEKSLASKNPDEISGAFEKLLEVLKTKLQAHYLDEKNVVFPELDELPTKWPLKLANLDHDDMDLISSIAENHIESAARFKDEKKVFSAVETATKLIEFIKKHFRLEEDLVIPLCRRLNAEQRERIMKSLKGNGR